MAMLPFAVMALSSLISYQRAKAESLGLDAKGGLMERAERVVLLCLGLLFEPLLVPVLWVMLVLTAITAASASSRCGARRRSPRSRRPGSSCAASRRQSRRVARSSGGAPGCRGAAPDGGRTGERPPHPVRSGSADALTVGAYRTGAALARYLPGVVAEGLAPPIGFGASFANAERRAMVERHLRRVNPTWPNGAHAPGRAGRVRLVHPLLGRELPAAVAVGPHGRRRHAPRRGSPTSPTPSSVGTGAILALPHLGGWEWAGRWLGDSGHRMTVVVERLDPPELFEWFVDLRERPRHERRAARPDGGDRGAARRCATTRSSACCATATSRAAGIEVEFFGERTTLPAGPGDARPPHRRADPPGRRVLHPPGQRPPRGRPPADPDGAPGRAARRRRPGDPGPGPRARVPDPPRPRAVAPVPTELAERPGIRAGLRALTRPQASIVPSMQVTVPPPTQTCRRRRRSTCTRPARPSAVPWRATYGAREPARCRAATGPARR